MANIESDDVNSLNGATSLPPINGARPLQNAWSGAGPAAFDFRSEFPLGLPQRHPDPSNED